MQRVPLELGPFVDECWEAFTEQARQRGLRFHNEVEADAVVWTDPDKFRSIVANLLANASEYTEAGGQVRVRGPLQGVILEVWDSGPAIPEAALPRLFDRFWRVDGARSASGGHCGIGLSIARAQSRALGLDLTVENVAGGVRFVVVALQE